MISDVWISKRQIFECEDFLASHRGLIGEPLENLQYGLRLDLVSPSSSFSSIAALMSLFSSSNIILRSTWRAKVTHLSNTNCLISFSFQINWCLTSLPSSPGSTPRWKRVAATSTGACAWGNKYYSGVSQILYFEYSNTHICILRHIEPLWLQELKSV